MVVSGQASEKSSAIVFVVQNCRRALISAGLFSALINVLALTSSLYMLQLYDRVIPSHSVPTLIGLSLLMLVLYGAYGCLDLVRTRIMSRIGVRLDTLLRDRVFRLVLALPLRTGAAPAQALQPIRDLDQLRGFLSGGGPAALFDMPWMPFYLGLVFLLHPWLGILSTCGAIVLVGLTVLTELRTRTPSLAMSKSAASRSAFAEASRRNAEIIKALGMSGRVTAGWAQLSDSFLADSFAAGDVATRYGTLSKVFRLLLQSAVLGLGAYLVVIGQATGGVMIAASILTSRALAPVEIAIANWKGFLAARQASDRLGKLFATAGAETTKLDLPRPTKSLQVEGIWVAAPGDTRAILQDISFQLAAGAGLGVIGPSASGKSTLVRAIVGAWATARGKIRIDGAALDQWSTQALGRYIGYLPQDIELFAGTVAENIARFEPGSTSEDIVRAAQAAGVHELVLRLPQGYQTQVGEGGVTLSAGQRQRIALARALYAEPFLVILDEPNSNLDAEGDAALTAAIMGVRQRGGIVMVVAHRPSALAGTDQILALAGGQVKAFGPRDEVLRAVVQPATTGPRFAVVSDQA